jgi:hypothetical protein
MGYGVRACVRVGKNLPQPPSQKNFFAACPSDYRRTDGKMTPIRAGEIRGARREAYVERSEKEKTKKNTRPTIPFPTPARAAPAALRPLRCQTHNSHAAEAVPVPVPESAWCACPCVNPSQTSQPPSKFFYYKLFSCCDVHGTVLLYTWLLY